MTCLMILSLPRSSGVRLIPISSNIQVSSGQQQLASNLRIDPSTHQRRVRQLMSRTAKGGTNSNGRNEPSVRNERHPFLDQWHPNRALLGSYGNRPGKANQKLRTFHRKWRLGSSRTEFRLRLGFQIRIRCLFQSKQLRYEDNSDVVALLDGKGGVLDMLDEE